MDEPFVTYGEAPEMLKPELKTSKNLSLHIGGVTGKMMNEIISNAEDGGHGGHVQSPDYETELHPVVDGTAIDPSGMEKPPDSACK